MIKEIWKDVDGWEGFYQISNFGQVRSLDRVISYTANSSNCSKLFKGRILKQYIDEDGYCRISFIRRGHQKVYGVHRLVAEAFILNPENKPTVNHKDGNKSNNNVSNLEWATYKEQNDHAVKIGLRSKETSYPAVSASLKVTRKPVICVETGEIFESQSDAERKLNLCSTSVWYSICTGKCAHNSHYHFKRLTGNKRGVLPNAIN